MTVVGGEEVFREVIRQGERMLAVQEAIRESTFRRAAELLRLSVATIGGILVVAGLFVSVRSSLPLLVFTGLGVGVTGVLIASGLLALVLNGSKKTRGYAYGPNLRRIVSALGNEIIAPITLLESLVEPLPDWVEENAQILAQMETMRSRALGFLAGGVAVITMTLFYILGGVILG